jgi:inner membrane protein
MNAIEQFFGLQAGWLWLILAALLAIAEIAIAPGVFFIFIAIAAAITGTITLFVDIGPAIQFVLFGIFSVISVYTGRYFYARQQHVGASPNLNDRSAQMIGQIVTVIQATSESAGRVRVGDGEWPARGPGLPEGTKARIVKVVDGCVHVEALDC